MAEIIRMPKLSDTMTEGVVVEWHKKIGDKVKSGELIAEIETDKATMEFESFFDGILLYIGVEKGKTALVDSILCILGNKSEDYKKVLEADNNSSKEKIEKENDSISVNIEETKMVEGLKKTLSNNNNSTTRRLIASPLAKKLAKEKNIDIALVEGSGDNGRVIKKDIQNYTSSNYLSSNLLNTVSHREEPISQMRKTIAKRLSESKFTAPHFYLTIKIDMDIIQKTRNQLKEKGIKVSVNDFIIKASAIALQKHPKINASWLGDKIRYNQNINIGVAVAVDEGLVVPVIKYANTKSISEISIEVKEFAKKAKDKKLQSSDFEGNTFTISNLGMYGIEEFTAIINLPDACIMAIGGIFQVPVIKNGQIVIGNLMKVTLSCDHRVVDGVVGAEFLNTFKSMLENPIIMLV